TADDLSGQILEQTALRIDQQINELLFSANHQGALNRKLLETGQFDVAAFGRLADYWLNVMDVHPQLTRISFGVEETGEWFYVKRTRGKLAIGELRRNPRTRHLELSDYWPGPGRERFYFNPDRDDDDPRSQDWYRAAKTSRRQAWSETYAMLNVQGTAD